MKKFSSIPANIPEVLFRLAIAAAAVFPVCLGLANAVFGPLNQDEGWYLLAALNVRDGMVPYRDFAFTQGPVMPYVYAALSFLWAPFGVLGGRIVTMAAGLAACAVTAAACARAASPSRRAAAGICAWVLLSFSTSFSYFTVIPKTYALSALFAACAFYVLSGRGRFRPELSAAFFALSAAARASMAAAAAAAGLYFLINARTEGMRLHWLRFAAAGLLVILAIYVPFLIICPENFFFCQHYHAGRDFPGFVQWAVLRAGFVSRLIQDYPAHIAAAAIAASIFLRDPHGARSLLSDGFLAVSAGAFAAVLLLHMAAPFPYDDYQTPAVPAAAAAVGAIFGYASESCRPNARKVLIFMLVLISAAFSISAPLCMSWVSVRQDRFWIEFKKQPDITALRKVGAWVRERTPENAFLLTQDAYIAVEARRKVLPGLEMGPFSVFTNLTAEQAAAFHVHTPETLADAIRRTDAPVALISGYGFALACPSTGKLSNDDSDMLFSALLQHYRLIDTVRDFGQQHTDLEIFERIPQYSASGRDAQSAL